MRSSIGNAPATARAISSARWRKPQLQLMPSSITFSSVTDTETPTGVIDRLTCSANADLIRTLMSCVGEREAHCGTIGQAAAFGEFDNGIHAGLDGQPLDVESKVMDALIFFDVETEVQGTRGGGSIPLDPRPHGVCVRGPLSLHQDWRAETAGGARIAGRQ